MWDLAGITRRELLRFVGQKERFLSALVRPLIWLFIFAAGFRNVLGVSIQPPYDTYVLYEDYVTPGLAVMIQLFYGMQSSLSMVYDREVGSMRVLLTSPFPRWSLLLARLLASVMVSVAQVYVFLGIAYLWGVGLLSCVERPPIRPAISWTSRPWSPSACFPARSGCSCPRWCGSSRTSPA